MWDDLLGAIIAERQHGTAALPRFRIKGLQQGGGALVDFGEAVDDDVPGPQEIVDAEIRIFAHRPLR